MAGGLAGCSLASGDGPRPSLLAAAVDVEVVDCPDRVRSESTACALVQVPIDYQDPSQGSIELSVLERAGRDDGQVLAVLQGGPGAASTDLAAFSAVQPFTQIFVDQRGTGFGSTDFDCPELSEVFAAAMAVQSAEAREINALALDACAQRLLEQPDFENLSSETHARDLVAVMGLFDRPWSAYGVSYGSTIVLETARLDPPSLESIIVDGVYPPDLDVDEGVTASATAALRVVGEACLRSEACAAVSPEIEDQVNQLVTQLDQAPIEAAANDSPVTIDGAAFAETVFGVMYDESRIATLPALLDGLAAKDPAAIELLIDLRLELAGNSVQVAAEGTYFGVQCHDRSAATATPIDPPAELTPYAAALTGQPLGQACPDWVEAGGVTAPATPVQSDLPALVLSGRFDPITPPAYGEWVATGLPNSIVAVRDGRGHGVWLGDDCVSSLIATFLAGELRVGAPGCITEPLEIAWDFSLSD